MAVGEDLEASYYQKLITNISLNSSMTAIIVSRVDPINSTEHEFVLPVLDFLETDETSINYIADKPVDRVVADISQYVVQPTDRVIHDELTNVTYIHKDGEVYIIKDKPIDNAYIRIPTFKPNRLYRGMSVVKFTNGKMYMSTKPTKTIPLSGGNDWIHVTEMDLFIARCEIDAEALTGSLIVDYLSELEGGAVIEAHYGRSSNSTADTLDKHMGAEVFPTTKAFNFTPEEDALLIGGDNAGLKLPASLGLSSLKSGSIRVKLSELPTSNAVILTSTQGNTLLEFSFNLWLYEQTGAVSISYRLGEGTASISTISVTTLSVGTEYLMTYVITGTHIKVYLDDGQLIIAQAIASPINANPLGVFVGTSVSGETNLSGTVRDVRFYDKPLSLEEIQEVYTYGN